MGAGLQPLSFLYPGPAGLAVCGHSLLPVVPGNEIKEKIGIKERICEDKEILCALSPKQNWQLVMVGRV